MELDNIIYIIITIAIFAVSLLGQSKKKKIEKVETEDEIQYSLNDFEKILQRKEEFKKDEIEDDEAISSETVMKLPYENDKLIESNKLPAQIEEKETDDGFDIKSAVVYSSILERKKFRR
jgi:hypothetical protein